jgi:hypothetical protein
MLPPMPTTLRAQSPLALAACTAIAALALAPAPADACSCSRPGVEVTPGAAAPAPTNTQVRVAWPSTVKVDESSITLAPAPNPKAPKPKLKKGESPPPTSIDVDRVALTAGDVRVVVLTPTQPLQPETHYQVTLAGEPGGKPGVVGEFTTGKDADTTAPAWKGAGKVTYVHAPAVCCNCSTGDPWVSVALVPPDSDDRPAPEPDVVYGVWLADGFDAKKPPVAYLRPWGDSVVLGHKSTCSPKNFDLPAKGKLALKLAPVDAAGNVGTPADVVVDLDKPITKQPLK